MNENPPAKMFGFFFGKSLVNPGEFIGNHDRKCWLVDFDVVIWGSEDIILFVVKYKL